MLWWIKKSAYVIYEWPFRKTRPLKHLRKTLITVKRKKKEKRLPLKRFVKQNYSVKNERKYLVENHSCQIEINVLDLVLSLFKKF